MKFLTLDEIAFFRKLFFKTISMFSFTYFSVAVTMQNWTFITPSLLSSLLYASVEMTKYWKVDTTKAVLSKKEKTHYSFII